MIDPRAWLSPEARFICEVAATPDAVEIAAPAGLDWAALVDVLCRHRLELSVGRRIVNMTGAPETARLRLRRRMETSTRRGMAQAAAVVRAAAALEQAGVDALALKGCALSQQLHGDPFRRSSVDIDLLVRPQQRDAALAALRDLGYRASCPAPSWMDAGAEISLEIPDGAGPTTDTPTTDTPTIDLPTIDLHVRLAHAEGQCPLDVLRPFDGAATVMIGRTPLRTLAPEVGLTYLAMHATRHYCRKLGWLHDIAAAGSAWRESWPQALELADRIGAGPRLRLTALLAHRLFAAPLPAAVFADGVENRRLTLALGALAPVLSGAPPVDDAETLRRVGLWRSIWWDLRLTDGWRARAAVLSPRLRPRISDIGAGRRFPGARLFYLLRKALRLARGALSRRDAP